MIDVSIKNYARNNPEQVGYSLLSQVDSVNHALRHSNLERHEVLKIEDRVQCHIAKFRRDILYSWKHSSWHEAGGATDQQSIHHVRPWSSQISFGEYSKGSTLWKLCCITKPQESKRLLGFRKKIEWRNNRGAPLRGRVVPNAHARSRILAFLVEIDRIANVKLTSLALSLERVYYRGLYKVVQPCQGGRQRYHGGKRKIWPNKPQKPMMNQWSSWSSWTWSPSSRSSWWDSSPSQTSLKSEWPTTSDVSATRLEHKWKNTSSGRPVAKRLRQFFFSIFFNRWLDNRRVTIRTGDARGYKLSRTLFSALLRVQTQMWRTPHTQAL